jgi:hypothetical protein
MSAFVNYFTLLAQDKRMPITREPVWSGLRGHRCLARIAERRTIEHQRTEDTQVEQHESLTRNIKSNLDLASRTDSFQPGSRLLRRGERTVPRRYIKSTRWLRVGNDEGYFTIHKGTYFPIEFNYEQCYWYCIKYNYIRSTWETLRVAPSEYFLDIQEDEVVSRSDWGILDGNDDPNTDNEEGPSYCFGKAASKSQQGGPEDIDVQIPEGKDEQYEAQLQALAAAIPVLTDNETKSYPTFSTIMATQTQTHSVAATGERSYNHAIKRSGPPGEEPPHKDPFRGFTTTGRATGGGGGGGDGRGDDEENPDDPAHRRRRYAGSNGKLSSKEPTVFTGDRKDTESFILEWQIYQMLNYDAAVMWQPFTRATLFLSFIKGPVVHEWNMLQVNCLMTCAQTGALPSEEFFYDTIEAAFRSAFTDTMSV